MFVPLIIAAVLLGTYLVRKWIRARRAAHESMYVTTWPEIEISQIYGGWDACCAEDDRTPRISFAFDMYAGRPPHRAHR